MNHEPIVSIIMASYNHAPFIVDAVKSVQEQTDTSWELLIADDASTDSTLEVLTFCKNEPRIKISPFTINRREHMRNFACERARGKYLAFLNSDDMFLPGKLNKQIEILRANPSLGAVFTHVRCIDEKNQPLAGHPLETRLAAENLPRQKWLRKLFLSGNSLCLSSAVVRRDVFYDAGAFNPLLIQIADLDLWIRICLKTEIHVISEPLTARRILPGGQNLSAASPAVFSRLLLEYPHVYAHYVSDIGLRQLADIFPELAVLLPEDTNEWRCYLLSRMATSLPQKPMRLSGFTQLHELLKNQTTTKTLLQRNCRLLRTLFLSEGTAGLNANVPGITWKFYAPASDGSYSSDVLHTCWTTAVGGTVCISFPNPKTAGRLGLSLAGNTVSPVCRRFRLYDQQTGCLIIEWENTQDPNQKAEHIVGYLHDAQNCTPRMYLPPVDFSAFPAKWIDIEIEVETAAKTK